MSETEENEIQNRQELKIKRKQLYKLFLTNPMHTRLAVEIKALDDQLAESSEQTMNVNISLKYRDAGTKDDKTKCV